MKIPKVLNLFSSTDDHAGMMLLAPDKSGNCGDCVFMLSPVSSDGDNSQFGIVISELKVLGEHRFEIVTLSDACVMNISVKNMPSIEFELNNEFIGNVYTHIDGKRTILGSVVPIKPKL